MTIRFNRKIYALSPIKKAIKDWKQFADLEFFDNKDYFSVKITDGRKDLGDEFINYVLTTMKNYPEINAVIR